MNGRLYYRLGKSFWEFQGSYSGFVCVDLRTGEEIWNITGYMSLRAIADGYLVGYNGYDNQIYVFGKGPSATTVSVSAKTVTKGSRILIEGTVSYQSPARRVHRVLLKTL